MARFASDDVYVMYFRFCRRRYVSTQWSGIVGMKGACTQRVDMPTGRTAMQRQTGRGVESDVYDCVFPPVD